jgi:hypothetical protein
VNHFSGFMGAIRDARQMTGRVPDTGAKIDGQGHGSWLGAIGYLALLDQIGSCFKQKNTETLSGNAINRALGYFTGLIQAEIDAIYALRCAFAHDYSLYNTHTRQSLQHCFIVWEGQGPLVRFPTVPWDGDYNNLSPDRMTHINLEVLGDLVEDVYRRLVQLSQVDALEIILIGGADELVRRYSFISVRSDRL